MNRFFAAIIFLCLSYGFSSPITVGSTPILDQSQTTEDGGIAFWTYERSVAQSFTAGLSGELAGINLWMGQSGYYPGTDLVSVSIVEWSGSEEGSELGAIDVLAPTSYASATYFDFSDEGIELTSGNQYAIILTNELDYEDRPDPYYNMGVDVNWNDNPYASGNLFTRINGDWVAWSSSSSDEYADMRFETYVLGTQVAAVPEPASLALMGMGVLGLGGGLFRRKKK